MNLLLLQFEEENFDEDDDDAITIKSAGVMLDERSDAEEIYHSPNCRCVTNNLISTQNSVAAFGNAVCKKRPSTPIG